MRRQLCVFATLILALAAIVPPTAAEDDPPEVPFLSHLFDELGGDGEALNSGIIATRLWPAVGDYAATELSELMDGDTDVRIGNAAGYLKVAAAWMKGAATAAEDALVDKLNWESYDLEPVGDRDLLRLNKEVRQVSTLELDLRDAAAKSGKLRAKALLRAQNRVLARLLGTGDTRGPGWLAYVAVNQATALDIRSHRIDAEVDLEQFELRYDGPETKFTRKVRKFLGRGIEKLRDLEGDRGVLTDLWILVGDKIDNADELPPGATRKALEREAKGLAREHKRGWKKLLNRYFHALTLIEKGKAALAKIEYAVDPTDPDMPANFFATVEPGDYYVMVYVSNGTGTGYLPNAWLFSRVGDGRATIESREQLWKRMSAIVTSAEQDFTGTFENLYYGALSFDRRGVPVGFGNYVPVADYLAMQVATLNDSRGDSWAFNDDLSYPEWDGYVGTRQYTDQANAVTIRIAVAYVRRDTPPISSKLQEVMEPGEYQIYRSLVLGPLVNGPVHLPVRTVHVEEEVDLYDELLAEAEALRTTFADTFLPYVDEKDAAEIQRRRFVLLDCGAPSYPQPILDNLNPPRYLLFNRYVCEPTEEDPFPSAVNLTVGFERIGD